MIIVQEIMTIWGKWACCEPWVKQRRAVPEMHTLPASLPPHRPGDLIHQYLEFGRMYGFYGRTDCFTYPMEKTIAVRPGRIYHTGAVSLTPDGDRWMVHFQDCEPAGQPEHDLAPTVLVSTLAPGQWAQVITTDLRTDGWGYNQVYRKRVLNIGNFETWPGDLFTLRRSKMCFHSLASSRDPGWVA